jgi:hypothetical protein
MNRVVWGAALAIVVLAVTSAGLSIASSDQNIRAGLWNNGQATWSDIQLLDVFWRFARGYRPEQPIPYSHITHAQLNKMECQYCHSGVNKSPYATIPSTESCMGCHSKIQVKKNAESIQKLKSLHESGQPIEWEPVHHLPEHVRFSHERHLKAGVGCQQCHGQIQEMEVVEKVSSLKMGWCLSCHRHHGASVDCITCHH